MEKKWYILQVYGNSEKKVSELLREKIASSGMESSFEEIFVPSETVTSIRKGRKVNADRKFYPGYVFVKMALSDETFHLVLSLPRVIGFLGGEQHPTSLLESNVENIKGLMRESSDAEKAKASFEVGDAVDVIEGPFLSFSGKVEEVDKERERLKVSVFIFDRSTPVELEYHQVKKKTA